LRAGISAQEGRHSISWSDDQQDQVEVMEVMGQIKQLRHSFKRVQPLVLVLGLVAPLGLVACGPSDDNRLPSVSITSPVAGATVAGTYPVQLSANDDTGISKIQVFARPIPGIIGTATPKVFVGASSSAPYVANILTLALPNQSELELLAVATDRAGKTADSDPVRIKVANPGTPQLNYFVAFTLPPQGGLPTSAALAAGKALGATSLPQIDLAALQPPAATTGTAGATGQVRGQATAPRQYAVEWHWNALAAPALKGYGVRIAQAGFAGPYERATAGAGVQPVGGNVGEQRYSKIMPSIKTGDRVYGLVTALSSDALNEGGYSNADDTSFLAGQESATPLDGASINDGRPLLAWNSLAGVAGYLYQVFSANPLTTSPAPKAVWSNGLKTTEQLSVNYPANLDRLPSGTYYWWVVGVAFDANDRPEALSYSALRQFQVP
jgi:hypothetical protein